MEKKKYFAIGIPILLALFAIYSTTPHYSGLGTTEETHTIGEVCLVYESLNGVVDLGCVKNTVTNIAKNQTRNIRMGISTGNTTWSSLMLTTGSTAASATDTTCEGTVFTTNGCGAANGSTTEVYTSQGNYSVFNKFLATGACASIAKVCLSNHTASASPLMASAVLSSAVTLAANENLSVYYYVAES